MGRKIDVIKRAINQYMAMSTPTKNSNQPIPIPPGFAHNDTKETSYHDQCLPHGLAAAANHLLETITLTRNNIHKWAILDSGATSNFLMTTAHVANKERIDDGITVSLPDGNKVKSTHECTLNIPGLPITARHGHIIPGLASHSLMSVVTLCNAGCEVTFNKTSVRVVFDGKVIMTGRKCHRTGLWMVPLDPTTNPTSKPTRTPTPTNQPPAEHPIDEDPPKEERRPSHKAANIIHTINTTSKEEIAKFHHQSLGSPPTATLYNVLRNHPTELLTLPGMSAALIKKYLPPSTATAKGHMTRTRKGLRSTKPKPEQQNDPRSNEADMSPPHEICMAIDDEMFCFSVTTENDGNVIYSDLPGRFPIESYRGMNYFFVAYIYKCNYIIIRPMKSRKDEDMVATFTEIYEELQAKGHQPALHVLDNECSKAVKNYITSQETGIQLVEPHNHRVNAAEPAVKTVKYHTLASLATLDPNCPIQLWCRFIQQIEITLNIMRTSRQNNTMSAYEDYHHHKFDWNKTPIAPLGTKSLTFKDPDDRAAWQPHGVDTWYTGPAMDHYRLLTFFDPRTGGDLTAGTFRLYPAHCRTPTISESDRIITAAADLLEALGEKEPESATQRRKHVIILDKLQEVLHKPLTHTAAPRVGGEPTTSADPTHPATLRNTKRTHRRRTRNNNPFHQFLDQTPQGNETPVPCTSEGGDKQNDNCPTNKPGPMEITQDEEDIPVPDQTNKTADNIITTDPPRRSPRLIPPRRSPRILTQRANLLVPPTAGISQAGLQQFIATAFLQELQQSITKNLQPPSMEEVANGVVHPITKETITNYKRLINDPITRKIWLEAMAKELGRLAQGYKDTKGTNTVEFMDHDEIAKIPKGKVVTYARIVVDYRPQKSDPNRVRITAGGNLINYPHELTTRTADITTSKIMWNSTISTPGARYACSDAKNFYLATPLDDPEYMRIPANLVPDSFIEAYNLKDKIKNGYIYMRIIRGIYGLPHSGRLANELLKERLEKYGYRELPHTPGLFKHDWRPVWFTLTVDDFGIKYIGKHNAEHLIQVLEKWYEMETDWDGALYCGITLDWHYDAGYVDISMPNYVHKNLVKYNHKKPKRPQHCPYEPAPKHFGKKSNESHEEEESPPLNDEDHKLVQQVLGSFLYYGRAVDVTILHALNAIAADQANPTERTLERVHQFLDYMATNPNAVIRFRKSEMILNVHSDASFQTASKARSRAGGYFFLGSMPRDGEPIILNGNIYVLCTVLKLVAASAAEAELGALFMNAQAAKIIRLTLQEMGHPQPATPIHIDNSTCVGIVNNTQKRTRSRAMENKYFWLLDADAQGQFKFYLHPGQENLGDYPSKAHTGAIHQHVRPYYLHTTKSPTSLPRAAPPSSRRGCAETLDDPYYKRVPLPRIAGYRKLDREAQLANMVQSPHWHDTLRRNIVLLSRNIAREANYANTLIAQESDNLYRAQVMYA